MAVLLFGVPVSAVSYELPDIPLPELPQAARGALPALPPIASHAAHRQITRVGGHQRPQAPIVHGGSSPYYASLEAFSNKVGDAKKEEPMASTPESSPLESLEFVRR